MHYPPYPKTHREIFEYRGSGEYMACTIVHRQNDIRQLLAYKKLRQKLGEMRFREVLVEGLDILSHARTIHSPAGWLYRFIESETKASAS